MVTRRSFAKALGISATGYWSIRSSQKPTIATNFNISDTVEKNPNTVDRILIQFSRFDVIPHYLDEDERISIDVRLEVLDKTQENSVTIQNYNNGDTIDISGEVGSLVIEVGSVDKSRIRGKVSVNISHLQVSKSYEQNFDIQEPSVPKSGVSRWTFDSVDTDGSTIKDTWSNNDGTVSEDATIREGLSTSYDTRDSYEFTESTSYLQLPELEIGDSWTFASWIQHKNEDQYTHIFTSSVDQGNFALKIGRKGFDTKPYFFTDSTGSLTTDRILDPDTPYHVTFTYDDSDLRIYVNATEELNQTVSIPRPNSQKYQVQGGNGEYNTAIHDDLRYYNRSLEPDEVSNLYRYGRINL